VHEAEGKDLDFMGRLRRNTSIRRVVQPTYGVPIEAVLLQKVCTDKLNRGGGQWPERRDIDPLEAFTASRNYLRRNAKLFGLLKSSQVDRDRLMGFKWVRW